MTKLVTWVKLAWAVLVGWFRTKEEVPVDPPLSEEEKRELAAALQGQALEPVQVDTRDAMKARIDELMAKGRQAIERRDELEFAVLEHLAAQTPEEKGAAFMALVRQLDDLHRHRGFAHPRRSLFTDLRIRAGLHGEPLPSQNP